MCSQGSEFALQSARHARKSSKASSEKPVGCRPRRTTSGCPLARYRPWRPRLDRAQPCASLRYRTTVFLTRDRPRCPHLLTKRSSWRCSKRSRRVVWKLSSSAALQPYCKAPRSPRRTWIFWCATHPPIERRSQTARVACLEDIIASKAACGRPKDLAQLPLLRETLRVKQALDKGRA